MDMKDYREQETLTNLKKELETQKYNIEMLLDDIEIYTCRDQENPYYKEIFSIECYNPDSFIVYSYTSTIHNKTIQESIEKVLKIINKKE